MRNLSNNKSTLDEIAEYGELKGRVPQFGPFSRIIVQVFSSSSRTCLTMLTASVFAAMKRLCPWGPALAMLMLAAGFHSLRGAAPEAEVCAICGGPFGDVYYSIEDKVTLEKKHVCKQCEQSLPECFVCGLPALTNSPGFVQLPDQRVLCSRDAKTAVLDEEEGRRIGYDVRDSLNGLFSRFTTFPETNVTFALLDRVHLFELFKVVGNDYHCPNIWGLTQTVTNRHGAEYHVCLMSALPRSWFEATCAHEFAHTWVGDHVAPSRRQRLSQDAEEGFCELVSFLYMESLNNQAQTALILRNAYTRGQIDLFVEAQRTYGFNEVLDWMQFGLDDRLSNADPGRIRRINAAGQNPAPHVNVTSGPTRPPVPDRLLLKGIIWDPRRPFALINNHTFGPNEEASVRMGETNVLVRCVGIFPDAVRLKVVGSEREETLYLAK